MITHAAAGAVLQLLRGALGGFFVYSFMNWRTFHDARKVWRTFDCNAFLMPSTWLQQIQLSAWLSLLPRNDTATSYIYIYGLRSTCMPCPVGDSLHRLTSTGHAAMGA